jgi:hypothetical protein
MQLERDVNGDIFVDPSILARRLFMSENRLLRLQRIGRVTSTVEAGTEEDEGLLRITVRCGSCYWRAILDDDLNVVSEEAVNLGRWRGHFAAATAAHEAGY